MDQQEIDLTNKNRSENNELTLDNEHLPNFKSFNSQLILQELDSYFYNHQSLVKIHKQLLHISHKIVLPKKYLIEILNYLKVENFQEIEIQIGYCQVLNNQILKNAEIQMSDLIDVFMKIKKKKLQAALFETLQILQQKQQFLKKKDFDQILKKNDLDEQIRNSLIQMKNLIYENNSSFLKVNFSQSIVTTELNVWYQIEDKSNQYMIYETKCQNDENQIQKSVVQEDQKKQNKIEKVGTTLLGSYKTIKILYEKICQNRQIEYKVDYLTENLFGTQYFQYGRLGELLCDRMIIEIFLYLSKTQKLNETDINKIFSLCNDFEKVKQILMKNESIEVYVNQIHISEIIKDELNEIEKVTRQIYKVFQDHDKFHESFSITHTSIFGAKKLACFQNKNNDVIQNIQKIVFGEFEKIRVSAIETIFNLYSKNFITLNQSQLTQIQELSKEENKNSEFRQFAFRIYILSQGENCLEVFRQCILKLKNNQYEGLDYVLAHFEKIIKLDFDRNDLKPLIQSLGKKETNIDDQLKISQILDKFQTFQNKNFIDKVHIQKIKDMFFETKSSNLKFYLFKIIWCYLKGDLKQQSEFCQELVKNIRDFDYQLQNLIILCLVNIKQKIIVENIPKEISLKLLDSQNIIQNINQQDCQMIIENDKLQNPKICCISAQFIYQIIQNDRVKEIENVEHFINALQSMDLTTIEYVIKIIIRLLNSIQNYLIQSQIIIENLIDYLLQIIKRDCENYLQFQTDLFWLYTEILLIKIKNFQNDIKSEQIECLVQIGYQVENDKIQKNVFEILKILTERELPLPIKFLDVLINDFQMSKDILQILRNYSNYKNLTKEVVSTIYQQINRQDNSDIKESQENTIIQDNCLQKLEEFIRQGLKVGDHILQLIIDKLHHEEQGADKYYKVLELAQSNLPLSDHIFKQIQLERAGYEIQRQSQDSLYALEYLCTQVQEGCVIFNNIFQIIANKLNEKNFSEKLIKILIFASSQNQIIPSFVVDKLNEKLNPIEINEDLIIIFINMLRNNQKFSQSLIDKLEQILNNEKIPEKLLEFFSISSQNCQMFSLTVIEQLCNLIKQISDTKQEIILLKAVYTKIQANSSFHKVAQLLNEVLILKLEQQELIPFCIKIIEYLVKNNVNIDQLRQILNSLLIKKEIQYEIKVSISKILKHIGNQFNEKTSQYIQQFSLNNYSGENLVSLGTEQIEFLNESFQEIDIIIQNTDDKIAFNMINYLQKCSNKEEIPNELIFNIAALAAQTPYRELQFQCIKLINSIVESNQLLSHQRNNLQNDQLYNTECQLEILHIIDFLVKSQFQLSDDLIDQLLDQDIDQLLQINDWLKNENNQMIVNYIERLIQQQNCKITNKIIQAYTIIIIQKKYLNLQNTINSLLKSNIDQQNTQIIIQCIYYACQQGFQLNQNWLGNFEIFLLDQSEKISNLSFKLLNIAKEKGYKTPFFDQYCDIIFSKLKELQITTERNIDLIDTINYLQKFDLKDKLKNFNKQEDLHINLLQYGIQLKNKALEQSIIDLLIKQNMQNKREDHLQFLKTIIQIDDLTNQQMQEIIIFKKTIGLQNTIILLQQYIIKKPISKIQNKQWLKIFLGWFQQMLFIKVKDSSIIKILSNTIIFQYVLQIIILKSEKIQARCLNFEQLADIFGQIQQIDSISKFLSLLEFININKCNVLTNKLYFTVNQCRQNYEIEIIIQRFLDKNNKQKLKDIMQQLLILGWNFQTLNEKVGKTLEQIKDVQKQESLIQLFFTLYIHKITPQQVKLQEILNQAHQNWSQQVLNQASIKGQKKIKELVTELEQFNQKNIFVDDFESCFQNSINQIYDSQLKSQYIAINENIEVWESKNIKEWAQYVKQQKQDIFKQNNFIIEALAVIKRAIQLKFEINLYYSQILSALVILMKKNEKGILSQVRTGEGKSIIISIIAIYYGLQQFKINIYTSSSVLAQRDSNQFKPLFKLFELECAENGERQKYIKGEKECYKKNIVYGEVSQFQFDYLRHHNSQLKTLGKRGKQIAIIDEVDNILIDESTKTARLSTKFVGTDLYLPIYLLIWLKLKFIQDQIFQFDSKYYFFKAMVKADEKNQKIFIKDQENNVLKVYNLVEFINDESFRQMVEQIDDLDVYRQQKVKSYIEQLVNNSNIIQLPAHFRNYLDIQLPNWIQSAIIANQYQENIHYIIRDDEIKPVDFQNTGVIQNSTYWGNGLHQFLQIKHQLKITSETFLTNFISNEGYFKEYNGQIFGFTGTLGSKNAQDMLAQVYSVDLVIIPQNNYKQFQELPLIVVKQDEWIQKIIETTIEQCKLNRGVLIICETILYTQLIFEKLVLQYEKNKIKLYNMNNNNQEKEIDKIQSGQIFIATNLAGRGTDINASEIEQYGGLHVILTFMPLNQRIEEQAFGRTARKGNLGTGQIIVNKNQLQQFGNQLEDFSQLKLSRDKNEAEKFQTLQRESEQIQSREKYFKEYCTLLQEFRSNLKESKLSKLEQQFILSSIEEKWAIFLLLQQKNIISDTNFENFRQELKEPTSELILNPYHKNDIFLFKLQSLEFDERLNQLKNFTQDSKDQYPYILQEYAYLLLQSNLEDKKDQALQLLCQARELIIQELSLWQGLCSSYHEIYEKFKKSNLYKQIIHKLNIIGRYVDSLDLNIKVIEKSQRLLDVVGIDDNLQNSIENKKFYIRIQQNQAMTLLQNICHQKYQLIYNDLTNHQDFIDKDEAIHIINQIQQNVKNEIEITLQLNLMEVSCLKKLIYNYQTYYDLNKDAALKLLTVKNNKKFHVYLKQTQKNQKQSISEAQKDIQNFQSDIQINMIISTIDNQELYDNLTKNSSLDIEFIELDKGDVENILDTIDSNEISISIKSDLKEINEILEQDIVQRFNHLKKNSITSYPKEAAQKMFENKPNQIQIIQIPKISKQDIQTIIKICSSGAKFNLLFSKIKDFDKLMYIQDYMIINAGFCIKDQSLIKDVVKKMRDENLEFQLILNNLNHDQISTCVKEAKIQQANVEIVERKIFKELFKSFILDDSFDIQVFEDRGLKYIIKLSEFKQIPYQNLLILGTLALFQLTVGALLLVTCIGATPGSIILQEGASDIISLIQCCYKKQLSWYDYFQQKTVSILFSIFTLGLNGFKQVQSGKQAISKLVSEKSIKLININSILEQTLKTALSEIIYSLVLKGGTYLASKLVLNALKVVTPQIEQIIGEQIKQRFSVTVENLLGKLYVQSQIRKQSLIHKINQIIADILKSSGYLNAITLLFSSVFKKSSYLNQQLDSTDKISGYIFNILKTILSIINLDIQIENICIEFQRKLIKLAQTDYHFQQIIEKIPIDLNQQDEHQQQSSDILKEKIEISKIINNKYYGFLEDEQNNLLYHELIIQYINSLNEKLENEDCKIFITQVFSNLIESVTNIFICTFEQQIVSPLISYELSCKTLHLRNLQNQILDGSTHHHNQQIHNSTSQITNQQDTNHKEDNDDNCPQIHNSTLQIRNQYENNEDNQTQIHNTTLQIRNQYENNEDNQTQIHNNTLQIRNQQENNEDNQTQIHNLTLQIRNQYENNEDNQTLIHNLTLQIRNQYENNEDNQTLIHNNTLQIRNQQENNEDNQTQKHNNTLQIRNQQENNKDNCTQTDHSMTQRANDNDNNTNPTSTYTQNQNRQSSNQSHQDQGNQQFQNPWFIVPVSVDSFILISGLICIKLFYQKTPPVVE